MMNTEEQKALAAKEFDRMHNEGAEKFGMAWLSVNMTISKAAQVDYAPETPLGDIDIRVRAILTQAAWYVCEVNAARQGADGEEPDPLFVNEGEAISAADAVETARRMRAALQEIADDCPEELPQLEDYADADDPEDDLLIDRVKFRLGQIARRALAEVKQSET